MHISANNISSHGNAVKILIEYICFKYCSLKFTSMIYNIHVQVMISLVLQNGRTTLKYRYISFGHPFQSFDFERT